MAAYQVLLHDLRGIGRLHMAVPYCLRVNHHRGPMFALVQAHGFIDAHRHAQSGGFRQLLQPGVEFAFSVRGAGRSWGIDWACVVANKDVAFKWGQAEFLLDGNDERPNKCG